MTTITESFNTANSDLLGPDLTWTEVDGDWDIVSNAAELISNFGSTSRCARAEHDLASADHYAEATVLQNTGGGHAGVCVRFASAAETYYAGTHDTGSSGSLNIFKVVAGTRSTLTTLTSAGARGVVKLEVEDNGPDVDLRLYLDGVLKLSYTDSSSPITGNTRCGIYGYDPTGGGTTSPRIDSFKAEDLGGGGGSGNPWYYYQQAG